MEQEIAIHGEVVRLGQLLKLAGLIDAGGEARGFLAAHEVLVNGEPEARRGRQLHAGDEVRVGDAVVRVTAETPEESRAGLARHSRRQPH